MVRVFRVIGSPGFPHDEEWLRDVGRARYDRGHDPAGAPPARRDPRLRRPPGGSAGPRADPGPPRRRGPARPPAGGRATAAAVPGARLVVYPGMGHDLPFPLWPDMIDQIGALTGVGRPAADR